MTIRRVASDSGSDEEVESVKAEGDDETGDSPPDQLRKQSTLDDYAGFIHLPSGLDEEEPATVRVAQRVDRAKVSPTTAPGMW